MYRYLLELNCTLSNLAYSSFFRKSNNNNKKLSRLVLIALQTQLHIHCKRWILQGGCVTGEPCKKKQFSLEEKNWGSWGNVEIVCCNNITDLFILTVWSISYSVLYFLILVGNLTGESQLQQICFQRTNLFCQESKWQFHVLFSALHFANNTREASGLEVNFCWNCKLWGYFSIC